MSNQDPGQRNVIVFLCDQLRSDYLSIYGCKGVPTPNLDRLAAKGVVFDRAIAQSPVCGPGRATMMTGRYVSDHGVWSNDLPFRDGMEYLPQRMNENGYRTGAFGKLHHYPIDDTKGFAVHHLFEENRMGDQEPYLKWLKERHPEVTSVWNHDDLRFRFEDEDYYEHWIASHAIDFIETNRAAAETQPFFAWISFQGPHGPYDPPKSVAGTCDISALPPVVDFLPQSFAHPTLEARSARLSEDFRDTAALDKLRIAYAEMIVFIDQQIGRVLETLESTGQFENTTILFSADHGEMLGDHGLEQKGPYPYHQHLEVPMMLSNHPGLDGGSYSDDLVGTIDLPGTVLDIAGDTKPLGMSRSLLGSLGPSNAPRRAVNFSEFNDSLKFIEDAHYRFCYYPFTKDVYLFNPVEDPEMERNLAEDPAYGRVVRDMLQHVVDFQLIAKGVRIEAHDLVAGQQQGLAAKDPAFAERLPVVFPLTRRELRMTQEAGVDATFNKVFEGRQTLRTYQPAYWLDDAGE